MKENEIPQIVQPIIPISFAWKERLTRVAQGKDGKKLLLTCVISALFFSIFILKGGRGIAVPIFVVTLYGGLLWLFRERRNTFSPRSLALLAVNLLVACCYIFVDSQIVMFVNALTLLALIPAHVSYLSGNGREGFFTFGVFTATARNAAEYLPMSLSAPVAVLHRLTGGEAKGKRSLLVLLGLLVSIPFTIVLLLLFSGGDIIFARWVDHFLGSIRESLGTLMFHVIFGTLFTFLFAGYAMAAKLNPYRPVDPPVKKKGLSSFAALGFLAPIVLVELVYIAAQFHFFFSTDGLPSGYTYASYVHNGFGQSVVAALLTTAIVLIIYFACLRKENGLLSLWVRIPLTLLAVSNILVFASTISRVAIYMEAYDLSVRRIAVCWLVALMGLLILGMVLKLWIKRVNLAAFAGVVTIGMVLLFNGIHPDRLCATVNTDRYWKVYEKSPFTAGIDLYYLNSLSNAALPQLKELANAPDPAVAEQATNLLADRAEYERFSWKTWCIDDPTSEAILKEFKGKGQTSYVFDYAASAAEENSD